MPATRYDYRSGSYEVQCQECRTVVHTDHPWSSTAHSNDDGHPVSDTFRWLNGPGRFQYLCRSCEREYNRARRAQSSSRRQSRVPGTSRSPLGIARRFGVEFECGVPGHVGREGIRTALSAEGLTGWSIKGDGSLSIPGMYAVEIVSPPLAGEDGEEQVRKAARALRSVGAVVNRTCGTHVHHDIGDLSVDEIKRVARGWFNNQHLINGLVSPSRRDGGSSYCQPLQPSELVAIDRASTLEQIRRLPIGRYRTLNLTSYGRHGTVEIRQHQGTLDAEKVISWMRLGQAIIDTAKVQDAPIGQQGSVRQLLAQMQDRLNETARTFLLGRAVEFGVAAV